MKAAVLEELNKLVVKEVATPDCANGGILVKVKACAICGSDLRIYRSGNSRVNTPAIIGHELSGEVVRIGKNVTKFKVGDRVAIGADVPCGECSFCESGIGNNCQINYAIGYQFQGGFAEYIPLNSTTVNYGPVHLIPDNVSYGEAALAEPLGCVLNALELAKVNFGDTLVIIGAGPIGCMIIEMAKKIGASKVIVVQRSRPRLEAAKQFNADVYICSSEEDSVKRVLEETKGLGADLIITSCPSPEAQVDAIKMAKNRGRVSLFGGLPKGNSMITIDANIIHYKELFIMGAHGAMPRHHRQALELIGTGTINAKQFMSHEFSLEDINEAFAAAEGKKGMRVIVKP
jgi:L-iditol 2-dehydrogenase